MSVMNPMITVRGLRKSYPMGKLLVDALQGVSLELARGDFVAVAGPSGSGKTTLMNIIGLIDTPSSGSVLIDGVETGGLRRRERTRIRQENIGFVFQSFNLLPVLTVFENVELPLTIAQKRTTRAERRDRVEFLLEEVGLGDRRRHKPSELSGGQQQRAAIARALVTMPKIVIADEPTANLDSANGERVLALMKKINREEGTTFIFSTHDPDIWEMANHIVFLKDGGIESERRR
ncbi:ABC transporter ATP-binding protein [Spirochaetia bacterium]|nr:ABC transporter ATP-binding protein [Spirochaetia bacterium]